MNTVEPITLNSRYRESGSRDSATWLIDDPIHHVQMCRVVSAQIPNSFYTFGPDGTDAFLEVNGVKLELSNSKVYTDGAAIATALNTSQPTIPNVTSLVFTYNILTKKLNFTYNSTVNLVFSKNERLGIVNQRPGNVVGNTFLASATGTGEFDGILDLVPVKSIHINAPSLPTSTHCSNGLTSIVAVVPMLGATWGGIEYWTPPVAEWLPMTAGETVSRIGLELRDQDGRRVDTNGAEWEVQLAFK